MTPRNEKELRELENIKTQIKNLYNVKCSLA